MEQMVDARTHVEVVQLVLIEDTVGVQVCEVLCLYSSHEALQAGSIGPYDWTL